MSNELVDALPETPADPTTVDEGRPVEDVPKPALVLIGGDDNLVCIDDTCLPQDAVR